MPEDKKTEGATDEGKDGGTPIDFEKWLTEQPDEVRKGYETHTTDLKSALQKEREANKERDQADKKRQREANEAERKRLAEQGEYQKLAEEATSRADTAEKRVAELEPMAERVKALEEAMTGMVDQAKKGLEKHILALLEEMPLEKQLAYLAEHGDALRKKGSGPDPTPDADRDNDKITHEERQKRAWHPRL